MELIKRLFGGPFETGGATSEPVFADSAHQAQDFALANTETNGAQRVLVGPLSEKQSPERGLESGFLTMHAVRSAEIFNFDQGAGPADAKTPVA